jgi:ubiquinone/menaquinone biosynthesis C-methylase UbiE
MKYIDQLSRAQEQKWDTHAATGNHNSSRPRLDLDAAAFRSYASGSATELPLPFHNRYPDCLTMRDARGKNVLCLASGGGHQSAAYGLLGANVTVLDISQGQLALDQAAAKLYGYEVTTVHGDMRDLSAFGAGAFDLVVQGVGLCFVPDVREVYREVFRVLRPKGLYSLVHCNPATMPVSFDGPENGWDGTGYRISCRYVGGPVLRNHHGIEGMENGKPTGEYRHLLTDIFNGLIEQGFTIRGVWESLNGDIQSTPGSSAHMAALVPEYFSILALKG